jgi:translation initiation factor IF-2
MTLIDIDDVAARQRLREIASANKAALDARVRQAAELAEQARQAFEREEAEHKAAQQRKAETEARAAEAQHQQREQRKQEQRAAEKPKFPPRPATLSLGAEEFTLARAARQAEAAPPPAAPTPVAPEPPAAEERPSRTFRLGARDEQDDASKQDKPARKRPPRPEADDDMSGRTWLR